MLVQSRHKSNMVAAKCSRRGKIPPRNGGCVLCVMKLNAAFKRNCRSSNYINGSMPGQNFKLEVSSSAWSRRVRGTKRCNDALVVGFIRSRIQSLTKPKMRSRSLVPMSSQMNKSPESVHMRKGPCSGFVGKFLSI